MASLAAIAGGAAGTALGGPGGAAVGAEIGQEIVTGFGLFHTSAAGPNADAAKAVYPLAEGGNLTAVQAIITRTGINTLTSKAPWVDALNQLKQNQPDYIAQAQRVDFGFGPGGNAWPRFGAIPPQQVITAVTGANAVYAKGPGTGSSSLTPGAPGSSALGAALAGIGDAAGLTTAQVIILAVVGLVLFFAMRKG